MKKIIDCPKCPRPGYCCQEGVGIDLEEAKKILPLKLHGRFFHLAKDKDYPSGYIVDVSHKCTPCTFLTPEGLCSVHIVDYGCKPEPCIDFPHDDEAENGLYPEVKDLCILHKQGKV